MGDTRDRPVLLGIAIDCGVPSSMFLKGCEIREVVAASMRRESKVPNLPARNTRARNFGRT